jgi:F-type H+-transporting ATPase subunit delta
MEQGYVNLMDSPAVSKEEKCGLLRSAFGKADQLLQNFLFILCEKRAFYRFSACVAAYFSAMDEAMNILRATAITARPMEERQKEALRRKLSELTGKQVCLETQIDADLIGGIRLRYEGVQLDGSLRSRLDALRRNLADAIV